MYVLECFVTQPALTKAQIKKSCPPKESPKEKDRRHWNTLLVPGSWLETLTRVLRIMGQARLPCSWSRKELREDLSGLPKADERL